MTLPGSDTIVTYPAGDLESRGRVLHVEPLADGRRAVLLDRTAFHPVDAAWPDQPSDRGTLTVDGVAHPIVEGVVAATDGNALFVGSDIPVRKGTEGWAFVVAHLIEGDVPQDADAAVAVDAAYRHAISLGHTACHVASLALDAALAASWTKDVPTDSLGSPAFDSLANETSTIRENGAVDTYRIGKSLRKRGFDAAAFADADAVGALRVTVDETLARWRATGATVSIERAGDGLTDRREWRCELPDGRAAIACGGTHATSLAELPGIHVSFVTEELPGAVAVTMTTVVG